LAGQCIEIGNKNIPPIRYQQSKEKKSNNMKVENWLRKWNLTSLKINAKILELELNFTDTDRKAAWEMYVELYQC